jgi:hypothetical protein
MRIIGWLVGPGLGVAGGLVGVYCSYKRAKGPRERRFVVRASIALIAFIGALFALLFFCPQLRSWWLLPYVIILTAGISYLNRRQNAIRREEQPNA